MSTATTSRSQVDVSQTTPDSALAERASGRIVDPPVIARISKRIFEDFGPYRVTLQFLAITVLSFTLLRTWLFFEFALWRTLGAVEVVRVFLVGLRFDLLAGLCFVLPQALIVTLVSNRALMSSRISRLMLQTGIVLGFLLLPFLGIAEYLFFDEFQSRFNYIAFEYLVYPTEVCCNIWQSYPLVPLFGSVFAVGGGLSWGLWKRFHRQFDRPMAWTRRYGILAGILAAGGGLWLTTGMRDTKISENRVANEIASNGWYSFAYYAWTCRFDYKDFYLTIDEEQGYERVRKRIGEPTDERHPHSTNPFDRTVHTGRSQRDWNVVIVLEESLGSDFIGTLGDDRRLTPQFDELTKQGILFDNFYATGNRTARALEAVLASFPPIPTESILKRDHSQRVYTLARALEQRGYNRLFMTGGTGLFDGMRSFMTANGFDRFVEQKNYENPVFDNAWGVSDEDLFHRALTEFDKLHADGKPFFSVLLTVSNHRPYTFPEGRIQEPQGSRRHAVRYADWALGNFFRRARRHAFYKKTLFVVMGDHGARVYGSQLFPIKSYRVPVLAILPHGERAGTRCHTLGCSMDVAPIIMGLLGGSYRSVFLGRDTLSIAPETAYAVMQHNHNLALLDARNRMCVLGAQQTAQGFQLDRNSWDLKDGGWPDADFLQDTIGFFQSGDSLYYSDLWYPGPLP
ncbi:MAG: LTA synthase family protein [Planctomycetaceae bacterium]